MAYRTITRTVIADLKVPVKSRSQKIAFPKGLTHFLFHMHKLNGANACAQEMDQNPIEKNATILK